MTGHNVSEFQFFLGGQFGSTKPGKVNRLIDVEVGSELGRRKCHSDDDSNVSTTEMGISGVHEGSINPRFPPP